MLISDVTVEIWLDWCPEAVVRAAARTEKQASLEAAKQLRKLFPADFDKATAYVVERRKIEL